MPIARVMCGSQPVAITAVASGGCLPRAQSLLMRGLHDHRVSKDIAAWRSQRKERERGGREIETMLSESTPLTELLCFLVPMFTPATKEEFVCLFFWGVIERGNLHKQISSSTTMNANIHLLHTELLHLQCSWKGHFPCKPRDFYGCVFPNNTFSPTTTKSWRRN